MKKFAVFSGFLGSGKTTTMMALTKYYSEHHAGAAMISNDLGHGVSLADNKLARLSGCNASQISEDCICYVNEKLAAVLLLITGMNLIIYALAVGSILAIGESVPWRELNLQHLAYWLLQLELAGICFGVSAFLRRGSAGVGLGIAAVLYFMNLIANITESAAFLKDLTPFGYCDGAEIASPGSLDFKRLAIGAVFFAVGVAAAYWNYTRKDIH